MLTSSHDRAGTENMVLLADGFYESMVSRLGPSSSPTTFEAAYSR